MTKLYEGCWGVTAGREKRGPMVTNQGRKDPWPFKILDARGKFLCAYSATGKACGDICPQDLQPRNDIICVFATEAEADAYLAGDTAEPAGTIYRTGESSYRFEFGDVHNPVMWPDGALSPRYDTRILVRMLDDRRSRSERELILRVLETLHREDEADRAEMAHLAAGKSCDAAADYVKGGGK